MENNGGQFDAIRNFFTNDAWNALSDFEKQVFCNMKSNYDKMNELGIAGLPPSFMQAPVAGPSASRRSARPKRPRARSADSGDEWSPSRYVKPAVRRRTARSTDGRGAARGRFQPPVKRAATTTETVMSAERVAPAAAPTAGLCTAHTAGRQPQEELFSRPPSPPYDFIGFTLEDQYKARHAVDTKAEHVRSYIIAEFKAVGEVPPEREVFQRKRKVVNYDEEEDVDDDYIFCDECDREWEGDCPAHGPLVVIPNTKVPFDTGDPERDVKTCPDILNPGRSKIPDAETGIWTEKDLPARQRFGPYEGVVTTDRRQTTNSGYSWEIKKCRRVHHYVDAGDSSRSNWLRLVNCARFEQEQNLIPFQYKGEIYYRTYKAIAKGSELLVYYGDSYARELNINTQTFRKAPAAAPPGTSSSVDGSMLRCVHCDYTCLRQDQLDAHVKRRHGHIGKNGKYKCECCEYSTNKVEHYNQHLFTHTGERPLRCDDCGRTFSRLWSLTVHRRVHTGQRSYSCDVCDKAFNQSSHLTRHRRLHTGEKIRQCEKCGATFSSVYDYARHMKAHSGVKAHRCQECSARFVRRTDLTVHMRTHTGERPYGCSLCPAWFSDQSGVKKHVIRHHTHDYRHRCDRCGKGFVAPYELMKHLDKCSAAD